MNKNSVRRGSSSGTVGSEIKFAGNDKEKMYEPKHRRKLVRVLTVVAYVFSVSLAAITLSLFYMFIYNPGKGSQENEKPRGWADPNGSPGLERGDQGALDPRNETYEGSLEKEEPRALPVEAAGPTSDVTTSFSSANFSPVYGRENATVSPKILDGFKVQ